MWLRRLSLTVAAGCALAVAAPVAAQGSVSGGVSVPDGGVAAAPGAGTGGLAAGTRPPSRPAAPAAPGRAPSRDVPARYLRLYRSAARAEGLDWRLLAAIGKNESDHGRSRAPGVAAGLNYARCCAGPMQLCTTRACGRVWQAYARDGDGDGRASVYDPADAIPAAAALLADLRAGVGAQPALLLAAYNAGPGAVRRYGGVPPYAETRAYVRAGLRYIAGLG